MKQKLQISWELPTKDNRLNQFKRYLRDKGARPSTIEDYIARAGRYIEFCGKDHPSPELAQKFRDSLMDRDLSRSTVNNTCFAMKSLHGMLGQEVEFPFLKRTNMIPYYFTSYEVSRIFDQINNIKHLAMFKTAFYGCLRASELCNLDIEDIDLGRLSIKVRDGKGGKTAMVYISEEAAETLHKYLAIRPDLEIKGQRPLFYTDYGALYDRKEIYRLVVYYKKKAEIPRREAHMYFLDMLQPLLWSKMAAIC